MKKLTLDETWRLCLSMWRWIAKTKRAGTKLNVPQLKVLWITRHGHERYEISENCFFCEYIYSHKVLCRRHCPGKKVDEEFDCTRRTYDFEEEPIAFYNKLVSLNRKRLAKRK